MAETREIIVKVRVDDEEVTDLNRRLNATSGQLEENADDVKAVNDQLKATVTNIKAWQSRIDVLSKRSEGLKKAMNEASDPVRITRLNKALNTTESEIKDISLAAKKMGVQVSSSTDKASKSAKGLGVNLKGVATIFAGGLIAGGLASIVSQIGAVAKKSIELYDIQATADAQLRQALKTTGNVVGRTFEELQRQAQALQRETLFGDEAIEGAQEILLTFTQVREEIFDRTTPVILDLATRMKTDLQSSALQVGKALNDPITGLGGLSRAGIQFTEVQKDLIQNLVETGETAKAQGIILDELEKQFGGAAQAAANAGAGGIDQFTNRLNDLLELIGGKLVPELTKFVGFITEAAELAARGLGLIGDSATDTAEKFNELSISGNALFTQIEANAGNTEKQLELTKQLVSTYGDYLPGLKDEETILGDLTAARILFNESLSETRAELILQARRADAAGRVEVAVRDLAKAENDLAIARERLAREGGFINEAAVRRGELAVLGFTASLEEASLEFETATTQGATFLDTLNNIFGVQQGEFSLIVNPELNTEGLDTETEEERKAREKAEKKAAEERQKEAERRHREDLARRAKEIQAILKQEKGRIDAIAKLEEEARKEAIAALELDVSAQTAADIGPTIIAGLGAAISRDLEGIEDAQKELDNILKGYNAIINSFTSEGLNIADGITGGIISGIAEITLAFEALGDVLEEGVQIPPQDYAAIASAAVGAISNGLSVINSIQADSEQNRINSLERGSAEREKLEREAFERNKQRAIAQSTIQAAQAILAVWSAPSLGNVVVDGILKIAQSALVAGITAAQIGSIRSASFKEGGYTTKGANIGTVVSGIVGERDETGAKVAGIVHEKEYVVPEEVLKRYNNVVAFLESARKGKPDESLLPKSDSSVSNINTNTSKSDSSVSNIDNRVSNFNTKKGGVVSNFIQKGKEDVIIRPPSIQILPYNQEMRPISDNVSQKIDKLAKEMESIRSLPDKIARRNKDLLGHEIEKLRWELSDTRKGRV